MVVVSEIELFEALAKEIGREKAKSLVEYVEHKVDKRIEEKTNVLATKEDLAKEVSRLEIKIAESKAEIIKWMFIFWVGTIGVLSGIMFAMFHAYIK